MKAGIVQEFRLQRFDSEQRNQARPSNDLERDLVVVRQMQNVVEEFVFLVPQPDPAPPRLFIAPAICKKVLEEFRRDVLVGVVVLPKLERDSHEVERVHGHPAGSVRLIDVTAGRKRRAPIEDPDVVEPEKPP